MANNKSYPPYVVVDIERDDESFSCTILGIYNIKKNASDIMINQYNKIISEWPNGNHQIEDDTAEAFNGDCWDWTAWHKLFIISSDEFNKKQWF